jgi:hypothetical protein
MQFYLGYMSKWPESFTGKRRKKERCFCQVKIVCHQLLAIPMSSFVFPVSILLLGPISGGGSRRWSHGIYARKV